MHDRSKVFSSSKSFHSEVKTEYSTVLKVLRYDNALKSIYQQYSIIIFMKWHHP